MSLSCARKGRVENVPVVKTYKPYWWKRVKIGEIPYWHYLNGATSHNIPKLYDGDAVRMRLPGEDDRSLGPVIGDNDNCLYLLNVNDMHYRPNLRLLRPTAEKPPDLAELLNELTESSEGDWSKPNWAPSPSTGTSPLNELQSHRQQLVRRVNAAHYCGCKITSAKLIWTDCAVV